MSRDPRLPTCVVLLTPPGRGAVATLLVDGPAALSAVEPFFHSAAGKPLGDFSYRRVVFGRWGGKAGEEIVACRLDANQIELHCHGGRIAAERIQRDLVNAGCEPRGWEQWLHDRAAVTGETVEAEARVALAQARTERTASILLDQLQGALREECREILDLAQHDRHEAAQRVQTLLQRSALGLRLVKPWRVVLAGPPNAGKSSLINAMAGYERAIVFDEPGTTRDVVTATTAIDGWPVELSDTAGLRAAQQELEAAGIARAETHMAQADVLLLVFDVSRPWTEADAELAAAWPQALVVHNKCDLAAANGDRPSGIRTSALTQQGIDQLLAAISHRIAPLSPAPGSAVPFTRRQVALLERALQDLTDGRYPIELNRL